MLLRPTFTFIPPAFPSPAERRAQAYAMPGHEAVERDSAPAARAGQFGRHQRAIRRISSNPSIAG